MGCLNKTRQSGITQCSMLMDPSERSVQFILKNDGERIWRLDFESCIIDGTSTDGTRYQKKLDESGILASELRVLSSVQPQKNFDKQQLPRSSNNASTIGVVFSSMIVLLGILMIWQKIRKSF